MGGILGMYLVHEARNHISGLLLNDIGLSLQWMSIYGLYDGMKKAGRMPEPQELADSLNVHVGAVVAVSSPAHFDLPYRKDWKGMQFGQLLNGFKGPVRLVHGGDSGVCLSQQVTELKHAFPAAQVLEVAGATHPVPFNALVNQFVLQSLSLPAAAQAKPAPVQNVKKVMFFEAPVATPKPEPVMEPEPVPPQEAEPRGGLLALLKRLLSATKK
jgi:pimeloyl-ACP methyl ester carboxylesterase